MRIATLLFLIAFSHVCVAKNSLSCANFFSLQRSKLSRIILGAKNLAQYKKQWDMCENSGCAINTQRIRDYFPDLKPIWTELKSYRFYDDQRVQYRLLKKYMAEFISFEIPLENGEIHTIQVIMIPNAALYRGFSNVEYATHLVQSLPYKTIKATHSIEIRPRHKILTQEKSLREYEENLKHGEEFSIQFGKAHLDGRIFLSSHSTVKNSLDEIAILLHEHGHNVGSYIFGIPHPPFWKKAIAKDNNAYPTDYAKTDLSEDFAETFSIYLNSHREKNNSYLREFFKSRTHAMDLLFSTEGGGLGKDSFWGNIREYIATNSKLIDLTFLTFFFGTLAFSFPM